MRAILLATSCLLILPSLAQDTRPPAVRRVAVNAKESPKDSESLGRNIQIRLHGTTTTGADVDLSLSGIGPRFNASQIINDDTMLTCEYSVSKTDAVYRVSYSISARIRVATATGPRSMNHQFQDVTVAGTVLCGANRSQVLVLNGKKPLQLTITEEGEHGGAVESAAGLEPDSKGGDKPQSEAE